MGINVSIVEIIQLMLAPGLMISACGLLILSMNNKYSLVVNRIRLLNEERRRSLVKAAGKEFSYEDNLRIESVSVQLQESASRVRIVRNAVLCYTIAVALFVLTSLLIGIQSLLIPDKITWLITIFFLLGMISVLAGVIYAAYESIKGYKIIQLEIKIDE
ncbi:MAG TPA: DUF2721 domain-containing protein [Ignavibacteriaceae bacterium]|nr:DUF2721 domain-containing protein [Ignavibacteriaceae bacterium]